MCFFNYGNFITKVRTPAQVTKNKQSLDIVPVLSEHPYSFTTYLALAMIEIKLGQNSGQFRLLGNILVCILDYQSHDCRQRLFLFLKYDLVQNFLHS